MAKLKQKYKWINNTTIFSALLVLVCIGLCVYHIYDTKNSLRQSINEQVQSQLDSAEEILSEEIADNLEVVVTVAEELGAKLETAVSDTQIYQLLTKYKNITELSHMAYLSLGDGLTYVDEGETIDSDFSRYLTEDVEIDDAGMVYVDGDFLGSDDTMIYYITPVYTGDELIGYAVGMQDTDTLLDSVAFHAIASLADVMIVDNTGSMIAARIDGVVTEADVLGSLFDYMLSVWDADESSTQKLRTMLSKNNMSSGDVGYETGLMSGQYFRFVAIGSMDSMYMVVYYTNSAFSSLESTVLIGTIYSTAGILVLMLILVMIASHHNRKSIRTIEHLAYGDDVTGGKNLNYFKEFVAEQLDHFRGMPFAMHRFDIVAFRYINESYGRAKADQLLALVVEEAAEAFNGKELCARVTADQFVLLTRNDLDLEDRFFIFTDKVNARALDIGIRYPIKFKRGVYRIQGGEDNVVALIDKANAARKELTGDEKECVYYYSEKLAKNMQTVDRIESEMEEALFNDEFKMFIQPKWDIKEDHLYGGEALVRWIKADGSMVYPSDFVPVFEKNGFVEQLDLHMLEMACQLIRSRMDEEKTVYPISVNQSRVLINNPEYLSRVSDLLARYEIPTGMIDLEITETVFMDDKDKMVNILNELRAREVMISMDDFGSGYSSLNMLKDFPFDVLKIDKEFFSESVTSNSSVWILKKIIEMVDGMGIKVICEGVETEEQIKMLQKIGCRYVQGYYYSKPIPAAEFVEKFCDPQVETA